MKIISVNRESICMADDVEGHLIYYNMDDDCTYRDVIEAVTKYRYLPPYDAMWLLSSKNRGFIAAYYKSPLNNNQADVIWQQGFNENDEIKNDKTFYFDEELLKREMYSDPHQYDKHVEDIKEKNNISDELFMQIEDYLRQMRKENP